MTYEMKHVRAENLLPYIAEFSFVFEVPKVSIECPYNQTLDEMFFPRTKPKWTGEQSTAIRKKAVHKFVSIIQSMMNKYQAYVLRRMTERQLPGDFGHCNKRLYTVKTGNKDAILKVEVYFADLEHPEYYSLYYYSIEARPKQLFILSSDNVLMTSSKSIADFTKLDDIVSTLSKRTAAYYDAQKRRKIKDVEKQIRCKVTKIVSCEKHIAVLEKQKAKLEQKLYKLQNA